MARQHLLDMWRGIRRVADHRCHAFAVQLKNFCLISLDFRGHGVWDSKDQANESKCYGFRPFWVSSHSLTRELNLRFYDAGTFAPLARCCTRLRCNIFVNAGSA